MSPPARRPLPPHPLVGRPLVDSPLAGRSLSGRSLSGCSLSDRPLAGRLLLGRSLLGRVGAAVALSALLAGCGGTSTPAAAPPPSPAAPATPAAPVPPSAVADPGDAACAAFPGTASTLRAVVEQAQRGPVLPAGVAFLLFSARNQAAVPGIEDPALAAAQAELVAAIDDLDAQGQAGLPSGGNPAKDLVQIDVARLAAAVDAVERACAARD